MIAELLRAEKYDEHNKRALCPHHKENTPSWIYNAKAYSFHCFACGKNTDLIDAYMETGLTYIQAVKKLFEHAGVRHSFGEHGVKDKANYRYPHEEPLGDKSRVYEYLQRRRISPATADYADVREDAHGNMVFNYYDTNDVLKMVKYRPSRKVQHGENKMWCQKDADTTPLLFNMNRINVTEPLIICEGELDCLALIEAGCRNTVSVPLGANNYRWIEENWDWLEQFESIILCGDNDEPGRKMIKEVLPRLGSWRVKVADLPAECTLENGHTVAIKDANDVLYRLGAESLRTAIQNAKDTPVPSSIDFADIPDVDLNDIDGIRTGFRDIDQSLLRLFYGSFNIISGRPGGGKTSLLYQIINNAIDEGDTCWIYSRELSTWLSKNWQLHIFAGNRNIKKCVDPNTNAVYYVVPKEIKAEITEFYRGRLMFYRDEYPNDKDSLLQAMVDNRRKYGARVFLLDNLMTIDLGGNDENTNERQTAFINSLIQFAVKYDACVILVAHPRKMPAEQSDVDIYDIAGSSNIINLAHRALGLRRVTEKERMGIPNKRGDGWDKPPNPYSVIVTVIKDRLRGMAGQQFGLYYDKPSRRFFSTPEEYDRRYKWDKKVYTESLPYPIDEQAEEVFGKINGK